MKFVNDKAVNVLYKISRSVKNKTTQDLVNTVVSLSNKSLVNECLIDKDFKALLKQNVSGDVFKLQRIASSSSSSSSSPPPPPPQASTRNTINEKQPMYKKRLHTQFKSKRHTILQTKSVDKMTAAEILDIYRKKYNKI